MSIEIFNFLNNYKDSINLGLSFLELKNFSLIVDFLIKSFKKQNRIFLIGNGGSSALASHFCCDISKSVFEQTKYKPKVMNLSSESCLFTASANDFGYDNVFAKQLAVLASPKDVLIAISSSGKSLNIINAIKQSKKHQMKIISFTGFSGGKVKKLSDYNIHIPIHNYGVVEDCHQIIMHMLVEYIKTKEKK